MTTAPAPTRGGGEGPNITMPLAPSPAAHVFLLAVFFASGFAALLYQTVWQRMLTLFGGADVHAITIIVSAFMAGLGFGNLCGGHWADRLSVRGAVRAFAVCELAIGTFALASPVIYYDWLYGDLGAANWSRGALAGLIFLVTLWPTFFMGMSLPLVSRLVTADVQHAVRWIPALYGWNTVGAAAGSLTAVTVLFRAFDFSTCVFFGAGMSAGCAIAALAMAQRLPATPAGPAVPVGADAPSPPPRAFERRLPIPAWLAVYALSGFIALSLEIVWFRVLGIVLKSNAGTFGFLLAVYLLGVGGGALLARHRRFQSFDPTTAFFTAQALAPAWAAIALSLLVYSVGHLAIGEPLWSFLGGANPLGPEAFRSGRAIVLYGGVTLWLVLPSTLLMGMSFALLQRAVQTDRRLVGRRLGWLQTANIVGAMAGALLTGIYLLDWFGSAGTFRALVWLALTFVALNVFCRTAAWRTSVALGLGLALVAVAFPSNTFMWNRLHAASPAETIVREDASGFVLLKPVPESSRTRVFISGISQSWLPYGSIHTALGALPVLLHPSPAHVAVIGLASGDTAFAIAARSETETIDSIEIMGAQYAALQALSQQGRYPALSMLLADPRVRHHFTDGRTFVRRGTTRYDVIEADALLPTSAYAGNLYSVEYFSLLRDALAPGGMAVTWTPTERTRASMVQVFPYVLLFRSVAIGSQSPIAFDAATVRRRLQDPFTARHFADGQVDVAGALEPLLKEGAVSYGPEFDRAGLGTVNHDLFPQDEFGRPSPDEGRLLSRLAR